MPKALPSIAYAAPYLEQCLHSINLVAGSVAKLVKMYYTNIIKVHRVVKQGAQNHLMYEEPQRFSAEHRHVDKDPRKKTSF